MCTGCHDPRHEPKNVTEELSRRAMLGGLAAGAAGAATFVGSSASAAQRRVERGDEGRRRLDLVLLGTRSGPPIEPHRKGIASALVVDGSTYLVDCGRSATSQYVEAGLTLASLEAIFVTHLHHDHVADYFNFFLLGGNVPNSLGDSMPAHVNVYGPGPAGGLPPSAVVGETPVVRPGNPTPGLRDLHDNCMDAHAYSSNIFIRTGAVRDPRSLATVNEITVPKKVGASFTNTAPVMKPFKVMEDDKVRVSAILVPHGPVFPSFAFRFDTDYGSVTFSGDTTYTPNIPTLARGTDILVHEALNIEGYQAPAPLLNGLRATHVEVQKVGPIAEAAGADRLVLSHIGDLTKDPLDERAWRRWAHQGYGGKVTVGRDLQRFTSKGRGFVVA